MFKGSEGEIKDIEELEDDKAINEQDEFNQRWQWELIYEELSQGDPLKWDALGELKYLFTLNLYSLRWEKANLERKKKAIKPE